MSAYRAVALWIAIIVIMMLTLNIKIEKQSDTNDELDTSLLRKKRAVGTKPRHVRGVCGGSSYGRNGWLASPNFPGSSYPALMTCNWTIIVFPRMVIQFDFVYIDMEDAPTQKQGGCMADYVMIKESQKEDSPLVGGQRYCGFDTTFPSIYTKSNRAYVYFKSDHDKEYQGFAIRWRAVEPPKAQFDCDFESIKDLCTGWEQSKDDDYDWTTHNGQTQSGMTSATGPLTDRTKKDEFGVYLYTEASGVKKGQKAVLLSPTVRVTGKKGQCLRFWYHMRGETMGTLNVYQKEILSERNSTRELVFSKSGQQSQNWKRADINVTATNNKIQFLFEGIRGSSYKSDMAIDDIQMLRKPCPMPRPKLPTTKTPATRPIFARTRRPTPSTTRVTRSPATTRRSRTITTTPFTTTTQADCFYKCKEVGNCVEKEYFCDGVRDCLHKDDEKDCSTAKTDSTSAAPATSEWDNWSAWTSCTVSCGGGRSERERKCIRGGPFDCFGSSSEGIEYWNEWEDWSGCSRTCGEGVRMRSRTCNGGETGQPGCIGPYIEVDFCNRFTCPKWGEWTQWSACQVSCGNGTKSRARTCQGAENDGPACVGNATETKPCTHPTNPSCGEWTEWTAFSECTRSCGVGRRMRSRQCRKNGVIAQGCPGSRTDEENCNTVGCPEWAEWKPYSACSVTCGNGIRSRLRQCIQDGVESQSCSGDSQMEEECTYEACKVWAEWAPWSRCTSSCGTGFHGRRRLCMKGDVRSVGCSGKSIETGLCNTNPCPNSRHISFEMRVVLTCQILCVFCLVAFCHASSWGKWSPCSATCGEGTIVRRRPCDVFELGCNNGEFVEQSKPCSLMPCGGLHCFEGISASVGGFETINTFSLRKCEDINHAPASRDPNGRLGLFCATTIIKVERNGVKFDMIQGTCLNEDLCTEVNCDRYKKLMGLHNIETCEVRCCGKDRCNDPELLKSKKDEATDTDSCSVNPCQNGGSCNRMGNGNVGYICACPPGFAGRNCTEAAVPVAAEMLTTTCESPTDKCMVASLASYVQGIPMYVDTAQCVKAEVCDRLKCSDLKKSTNQFDIASCKIYCCSDDYCNNVPTKMPPLPTTTSYSPGTVRPTKRTTTKKPRPTRPTTRKPTTRRITPRTTTPTTTEATTVDTSGPHWSKWQNWQSCTHPCGSSGTQRRYRYCMKGAPGMPGCTPQNADREIIPCNTGVSCIRWREWGNWQSCSRTCGGGRRERRRSCDGGAPNTGDCIGSDMEQEDCNVQSCTTTTQATTTTRPPTTPKRFTPRWSKWLDWNPCSERCGLGTQQRRRVCIGGIVGRRGCRGKVKETQDCNEGACTTTTTTTATTTTTKKPRGWGLWTDWSSCSVSCGKGTETRTRECHGTKPGRKGCRGKKKDIRTCQTSCPEPTPAATIAKCFTRNAAKAKKSGRKCPPKCTMDEDCQREKKCVCDGLCGKTCQSLTKRCSDIASQNKKPGTTIACSAGNSVGSVCTFSCQEGYKLDGDSTVICQGTSKWTNEKNLPTCTASTTAPTTPSPPQCDKKRPTHNACCGKKSYNSRSSKCCDGRVSPGGKKATECCAFRPYDPKKRGCCKNKVFWLSREKCKNGRVVKK